MTTARKGISTRFLLVAALVLVIGSVTVSSLLVIRDRMQTQVLTDFSSDLTSSVVSFKGFQSQRLAALERENALLADLPSLRALMTTSDERTIEDGAVQFWKLGDNDLFALTTGDGTVIAAFTRGTPVDEHLRERLRGAVAAPGKHFLLSDGRLFQYSVRPLFFGSEATGTLLGYVISGYAVDAAFLRQVNGSSQAEISFIAQNAIVASTLPLSPNDEISHSVPSRLAADGIATKVSLGTQQYLAIADDLSQTSAVPLRLVVMKSFKHAEGLQHEINRLILLVGLFAVLAGSILMLALAAMVTAPLELLARSVRAFGTGNGESVLPKRGTQEVRELSIAFAAMRDQIVQKNRALVESERLATIGRMASSVSHDLRHYLAAVYANAEFLASSRLTAEERVELFADISMAVHGTTELIDSLLIFSRTNGAVRRAPELVSKLLERALALVKSHPDALKVSLQAVYAEPGSTAAVVDAKQMERAIYNLLLNASQAARASASGPEVKVAIETSDHELLIRVTDSGPGVSEGIRESLFEPFVSEGKQNGTGLGLTLAHAVAQDHGGSVKLVSSRPGETVFVLLISRGKLPSLLSEQESATEVTL